MSHRRPIDVVAQAWLTRVMGAEPAPEAEGRRRVPPPQANGR